MKKRYEGYLLAVLIACLCAFLVASCGQFLPSKRAKAFSFVVFGLCVLCANSFVMTIFGGICGFRHPRWCMCSRESGLYLFSFGIVRFGTQMNSEDLKNLSENFCRSRSHCDTFQKTFLEILYLLMFLRALSGASISLSTPLLFVQVVPPHSL